MLSKTIICQSYFDGKSLKNEGPYSISIDKGRISSITSGSVNESRNIQKVPFLMPGLVEAHCHLFLNGSEINLKARNDYFNSSFDQMLVVARNNVADSLAAGITLIRDAGDKHGVNHAIKKEGRLPVVRSPGLALRRPKRYGGFMAQEVASPDAIVNTITEFAGSIDDLKIIQTGIIDFEHGIVKGDPQFDLESLSLIVQTAKKFNLRTFAHCSGSEGNEIAIQAGVNSIEHGFFLTEDQFKAMADKSIAWVPTFSPVYFQWNNPEIVGWNDQSVSNLRSILDLHFNNVALAHHHGVDMVAGSDAGSHGVKHGDGLIDELFHFHKAGIPLDSILESATSLPRRLWGAESSDIAVGNQVDFVALAGNPFEEIENLRKVVGVYQSE